MQSPDIECYVVQHPWLENDSLLADIILPVSTKFEMSDIGNDLVCNFMKPRMRDYPEACNRNYDYLEEKEDLG